MAVDVDFYYEILDHSRRLMRRAQQELNSAERTRRINVAMAVRAGVPKIDIANRLAISRPTLDAWLSMVNSTPDELAAVDEHFRFLEQHFGPDKVPTSERTLPVREDGGGTPS